ncbi:hypothetical protein Hanom_Chr15g01411681 [Helianthus anomalus]
MFGAYADLGFRSKSVPIDRFGVVGWWRRRIDSTSMGVRLLDYVLGFWGQWSATGGGGDRW